MNYIFYGSFCKFPTSTHAFPGFAPSVLTPQRRALLTTSKLCEETLRLKTYRPFSLAVNRARPTCPISEIMNDGISILESGFYLSPSRYSGSCSVLWVYSSQESPVTRVWSGFFVHDETHLARMHFLKGAQSLFSPRTCKFKLIHFIATYFRSLKIYLRWDSEVRGWLCVLELQTCGNVGNMSTVLFRRWRQALVISGSKTMSFAAANTFTSFLVPLIRHEAKSHRGSLQVLSRVPKEPTTNFALCVSSRRRVET